MNVNERYIDFLEMKGKPIFDGEIKKIRLSEELLIVEKFCSPHISYIFQFSFSQYFLRYSMFLCSTKMANMSGAWGGGRHGESQR